MVDEATTIGELLEGCSPDALELMAPGELAAFGEAVLAVWGRLEAARLRLIAALDRAQAYRVDGARDMPTWLAWKSGDRRGAARRDVELAATVSTMAAVSDGLAGGEISKAKAVELARASAATPEQQAALVAEAKAASPEGVARCVDRWELEHAATPPVVEEDLTVTAAPGGAHIHATVDTEGAEWVQVAVDAAAERLGLRDLGWGRRRARGLVAIARYFLEHADVPTTRVGRPTVVVTIDVETLAAATGGAARLDSGAYVSGDVARRLACDAGVVRLVTDPASMPLDLGRKTRVPSPAQCRAVIHRDRHCRYEGCEAPPWACEVHHVAFWGRDGGRTDVAGLALICWHHHGLTHRQSTTHDLVDRGDGRLHLRRRRTERSDAA